MPRKHFPNKYGTSKIVVKIATKDAPTIETSTDTLTNEKFLGTGNFKRKSSSRTGRKILSRKYTFVRLNPAGRIPPPPTGNSAVEDQVAKFTQKIKYLTEHLKENKKDLSTKRSLINLIGKRRKMLDYLKGKDIERYKAIIKKLGIRK